jgi:hypothetical protein
VQPLRLLLRIALGIEGQQSCQHVVADDIGPAVAPWEFFVGFDGAVAAELRLEVAGFCGGGEEEIAAGDALLQIGGQQGIIFDVEVVEAEPAGAGAGGVA